MSSRREQIFDELLDRLNTDRPEGVPEASRDRINPHELPSLPAINLCIPPTSQAQEIVDRPDGRRGALVRRVLRVGVETYNAGSSTAVLDDLLSWVTATLVSDSPGQLFDSCEEEATTWQTEGLDADYRKATMILRVTYWTRKTDQTAV